MQIYSSDNFCLRVFLDEGPLMADLLCQDLSLGMAQDYFRRLLAAFPTAEPVRAASLQKQPSGDVLIENLCEQEIEVLQLIAEGLTNQEIVKRLYLSLNTIKVHTRNIYSKLDVNSRTQAVAKAKSLDILPAF